MGYWRPGFAARCEATALPRRNVLFFDSGYAHGSGCALQSKIGNRQ